MFQPRLNIDLDLSWSWKFVNMSFRDLREIHFFKLYGSLKEHWLSKQLNCPNERDTFSVPFHVHHERGRSN
jgi:hypothetical protein